MNEKCPAQSEARKLYTRRAPTTVERKVRPAGNWPVARRFPITTLPRGLAHYANAARPERTRNGKDCLSQEMATYVRTERYYENLRNDDAETWKRCRGKWRMMDGTYVHKRTSTYAPSIAPLQTIVPSLAPLLCYVRTGAAKHPATTGARNCAPSDLPPTRPPSFPFERQPTAQHFATTGARISLPQLNSLPLPLPVPILLLP